MQNEFRNPLHCVLHGPIFALFGELMSLIFFLVTHILMDTKYVLPDIHQAIVIITLCPKKSDAKI